MTGLWVGIVDGPVSMSCTSATQAAIQGCKLPGQGMGNAYNGHFESVCYHPLFLFTEHGDCLGATLRPGNVHSADDCVQPGDKMRGDAMIFGAGDRNLVRNPVGIRMDCHPAKVGRQLFGTE